MWDIINTIINVVIAVFSAFNSKRTKSKDDEARMDKESRLSYLAKLLDNDSDSQHLIAIRGLCEYAETNKSSIGVICDMLCSHIKRINAAVLSPVSDRAENSPEIKRLLEILFDENSIFKDEQKDLQDTFFLNWHLGKTNCVRNVNFSGSVFTNCEFHQVTFYNCKMSAVVIDNCTFKTNMEFNKCLLNKAQIKNNTLFKNAALKDSTLKDAKIDDTDFVRTDMGNSIFYNAELSGCQFIHCDMLRCDFTFAYFRQVTLKFENSNFLEDAIRYFNTLNLTFTIEATCNMILIM